MFELFVNSGDPDQMQCSAASDLSLHCLPITLLGVSRLQWVNTVFLSFDPKLLLVFTFLYKEQDQTPYHSQ